MKGFALIQLFHSFLNIIFFVQQSRFPLNSEQTAEETKKEMVDSCGLAFLYKIAAFRNASSYDNI